jgi:hypothetical protein
MRVRVGGIGVQVTKTLVGVGLVIAVVEGAVVAEEEGVAVGIYS